MKSEGGGAGGAGGIVGGGVDGEGGGGEGGGGEGGGNGGGGVLPAQVNGSMLPLVVLRLWLVCDRVRAVVPDSKVYVKQRPSKVLMS